MFKPVKMLYVRAVILTRDRRPILRALGKKGVIELTATESDDNITHLAIPESKQDDLDHIQSLITQINTLTKEYNITETGIPQDELTISQIEKDLQTINATKSDLQKRANTAQTHLEALKNVNEILREFNRLNLPINELKNYNFLHFIFGSIPNNQLSELQNSLEPNIVLLTFPRTNDRTGIIGIASRTGRFAMLSTLKKCDIIEDDITTISKGTLQEMLIQNEQELTKETNNLHNLTLAQEGLKTQISQRISNYQATLIAECDLIKAEEKVKHTNLTTLLTGWIPAKSEQTIRDTLETYAPSRYALELLTPEEVPNIQPPVLLKNSWLLRPFELLISGYGTPRYNDIEPTLFVAITYMLMFGMMFGDFGHGIILILAGLAMAIFSKKSQTKDVGTLVTLGGIASSIFGLIYGSFFGLKSFHKYALWKDPLDNATGIMTLAIGTGVLVISIGVILNIISHLRKGNLKEGLLSGTGVIGGLFYWGALGILLKYAALRAKGLAFAATALFIVLPLLIWVIVLPIQNAIKKRKSGEAESLPLAIMEGFIETFETALSYMSNTISFIRIAAYAMSHAAILMATFILADNVVGPDALGGIARILVIILGNTIAIILEGIIAAVQAMRLEYYEFFSKFFPGGGEEFKPFKL